MGDYIFFLGLSLLLTHELDAIRCSEWRVFPLTASMNDTRGYHVFTLLHIPLFALLFWALSDTGEARTRVIIGLDLFFIVHVALHIGFRKHPAYAFAGPFSWALIGGSGFCGFIDLLGRWV